MRIPGAGPPATLYIFVMVGNAVVIALLLHHALGAGSEITVSGDAKTVAVPKGGKAYWVQGDGLSINVKGPGALVLEVRDKGRPAKPVKVSLVRDDRWLAEKNVALKPNKARAPKGFLLHGQMAITLAAGEHHIRISSARDLLVVPRFVKKLPKALVPTPEALIQEVPASPAVAATVSAGDLAELPIASLVPTEPLKPQATVLATEVMESTSTAIEIPKKLAPVSDGVVTPASDALVPMVPARAGGMAQALRVAVYNFEVQGVDPNVGAVVTDSMLGEVRKLQGVSAIGSDEIRAMLSHEANKQFLGCEANESCLAEIAGALGVDNLISGKLARVDDGAVFLARRIDQGRAKIIGVVDRRLKAESGQEFLALIGPTIQELFPDHALREGAERGVAKDVALRLDPPPLPTWSFYTVAGGAVAVAAVGGFFGLQARNSAALFDKRAQDSVNQPINAREVTALDRDARNQTTNANYAFLGAGVMALTAGVMALFTDWHGYGDAAPTSPR